MVRTATLSNSPAISSSLLLPCPCQSASSSFSSLRSFSVPALRVLDNETRKKGTIVTIVKKYLATKKAEREARRA